jgi:hypothetical protein
MVFSPSMIPQIASTSIHRTLMDGIKILSSPMRKNREKCISKWTQEKRVTSMDLKQHHVIQFLDCKGLKLDSIAAELSSTYGQDVYERASIKHWLDQLKRGRTDLRTGHGGGDRRLAISTPKFSRFSENTILPQSR